MDETRAVESGKVRPKQNKHLIDPKWKGENTPYFDLLSPEKPKKKKKRKHQNSYSDLLSPKKASWVKWLENKGLGALGEGKLDRKTGKPMKLKPRKITLDDFESEKQIDEKERKHREAKEKR